MVETLSSKTKERPRFTIKQGKRKLSDRVKTLIPGQVPTVKSSNFPKRCVYTFKRDIEIAARGSGSGYSLNDTRIYVTSRQGKMSFAPVASLGDYNWEAIGEFVLCMWNKEKELEQEKKTAKANRHRAKSAFLRELRRLKLKFKKVDYGEGHISGGVKFWYDREGLVDISIHDSVTPAVAAQIAKVMAKVKK